MKNHTCHDAAHIIKYDTFLKKLKHYKVTLKIYPLEDLNKPGIYIVIIENEDQFIDMAYEVNVLKRTYLEIDLEVAFDFVKKGLMEYKIEVNRKKEISYGHE